MKMSMKRWLSGRFCLHFYNASTFLLFKLNIFCLILFPVNSSWRNGAEIGWSCLKWIFPTTSRLFGQRKGIINNNRILKLHLNGQGVTILRVLVYKYKNIFHLCVNNYENTRFSSAKVYNTPSDVIFALLLLTFALNVEVTANVNEKWWRWIENV